MFTKYDMYYGKPLQPLLLLLLNVLNRNRHTYLPTNQQCTVWDYFDVCCLFSAKKFETEIHCIASSIQSFWRCELTLKHLCDYTYSFFANRWVLKLLEWTWALMLTTLTTWWFCTRWSCSRIVACLGTRQSWQIQ